MRWPIFGDLYWTLAGISKYVVEPLEFGFLLLGLAGYWMIGWRRAEQNSEEHTLRAFVPWRWCHFYSF